MSMHTDTDRIRALNDELRKHLLGGGAVITTGIAELGAEAVKRLVKTIAVFENFCQANDPHQEHDFGNFTLAGQKFFFKIDAYDANMEFGSEDPADPSKTTRVLTIMLAEEY